MIAEETIAEQATAEPAHTDTPPPSAAALSRYVLTVFAVMAILYLIPLFLARSEFYERYNLSFYARPLNWAFKTANQNADVVIFGDSTALLGINPAEMSSALGVKVLNLVSTRPSLMVNDDLQLRRYLAANRPPRLIVFYFAPWDFDYGHQDFDALPIYEGQELLIRQGTRAEILAFIRNHPADAAIFPLRFYASALQLTLHRVSHPNQEAQLNATLGHVDSSDQTVLATPCAFPPLLLNSLRFDWVRALGEKYRTPHGGVQTQVMFYVAPIPSCANTSQVLAAPYAQLPAAPPAVIPAASFTSDVRYIHPRADAVSSVTSILTAAVKPVLAASPSRP